MTYTVGNSGVANYANTKPGLATGVVADAYNGYGDAVGDGGVSVTGNGITAYYMLMENSGFVLLENGDKIQLET